VAAAWRRAWEQVIPFFAFPPEVRRVIYTTNAIESLNAQVRKIIKTRGHFPTDEAATKLIWLALRNITDGWGKPMHAGRRHEPVRHPVRRALHSGGHKMRTVD
jgi:transposase-like protein